MYFISSFFEFLPVKNTLRDLISENIFSKASSPPSGDNFSTFSRIIQYSINNRNYHRLSSINLFFIKLSKYLLKIAIASNINFQPLKSYSQRYRHAIWRQFIDFSTNYPTWNNPITIITSNFALCALPIKPITALLDVTWRHLATIFYFFANYPSSNNPISITTQHALLLNQ